MGGTSPCRSPRPGVEGSALVTAVVAWSVAEALLRAVLAWRPVVPFANVVVALSLLWRRSHPLAPVVASFAVLTAVDVARTSRRARPDCC